MEIIAIVLIAVDVVIFFVALFFVLMYSWPKPHVPRDLDRSIDRGARVPSVRKHFEVAECDWAFVGREITVYRKGREINGVDHWSSWYYDDTLLVFARENDEKLELELHDKQGLLHTTCTSFAFSGGERMAHTKDTLFVSQVGRVLAFRVAPGGLKHVATLDPHFHFIFRIVCQGNGLLVLWCGEEHPEVILTFDYDHGFIRRSQEKVQGDLDSQLGAGTDWFAADTVDGLFTTKKDYDEVEEARGTLRCYDDWLWYDAPDTPFHGTNGDACTLISLGARLVVKEEGKLKIL